MPLRVRQQRSCDKNSTWQTRSETTRSRTDDCELLLTGDNSFRLKSQENEDDHPSQKPVNALARRKSTLQLALRSIDDERNEVLGEAWADRGA